uniref:Uncharacterized protein n=1 Tax=Otus sunia TaxID=257818 RepID=A0A8C8A8V5_9STRI
KNELCRARRGTCSWSPRDRAASVPGCWQGLTTGPSHAKKLLLGVWFALPSNRPRGVKQPSSAIQQRVSIQLIQDGRKRMALASNSSCLNFITVNNLKMTNFWLLWKGHPVGDSHGVQGCQSSQCVSLLALYKGK